MVCIPRMLCGVDELTAVNMAAEAALWRFILDIDLATEVIHHHHPQKSNFAMDAR